MKGIIVLTAPSSRDAPLTEDILAERPTQLAIAFLIAGLVVFVILIAVITIVPSRTISDTITAQTREQQKLLSESFARQIESFLNARANDLIGLANRTAVQSTAQASRAEAFVLFSNLLALNKDEIRSVVRLDAAGQPLLAAPQQYNDRIISRQSLPWAVDQAWLDAMNREASIQFTRRSTPGGVTYLLAETLTFGQTVTGYVVLELELKSFMEQTFSKVQLGETAHLWIFDMNGSEVYQNKADVQFRGGIGQLLGTGQTIFLGDYPSPGQEAYISPVFSAFTPDQAHTPSLTVVFSRAAAEGQQAVVGILTTLFLLGMGIITLMVLFGVVIGRSLLREANRRRAESQRKATARTLLDVSRALNASLDLNVVLSRILVQLRLILPHDRASVFLLDESKETVTPVAQYGGLPVLLDKPIPLMALRGAGEVMAGNRSVVINDVTKDPLWRERSTDIPVRAWMGVPLRLRDQVVGVLNIDSFAPDRFQPDDVELAQAFADQASTAIQSARAHQLEISTYESELRTAEAIQSSLLPQEPPPIPHLDVAAISLPARHVSGDFYQYFVLPDGKFGLAVGDVSGKGIPAALLMAVITTALRDEIFRWPSPARLLDELNARLLARMQQTYMNGALVVGIFDPETGCVELANGGLIQPYVRTAAGWNSVPVGGYPLGASSRSAYESASIMLTHQSALVFVTDGITDAQDVHRKLYGFERLEALLNGLPDNLSSQQILNTILDSVREFLIGKEPDDDITIVVVKPHTRDQSDTGS